MQKKELKRAVQKQLWSLNKKVRDMEGIPGVEFDLLVEGTIRVSVFGKYSHCDVWVREKNGKKEYAMNEKELVWKSPTEIFGPKK